jgi:SET domain-containing protein
MKKMPHYEVYTRLAPSTIHGIGVHAIIPIKKATHVFYGDENTEIIWIKKSQLKKLPKEIMRLYDDFCIIKDKGQTYGCPKNFNLLTISWYLNHSDNPNLICDKDYNFYTSKSIKKGEELTVNYNTFSE